MTGLSREDCTGVLLFDPAVLAYALGGEHRCGCPPEVVSELAALVSMALPSLMQHLGVLENAGLITSQKHGRVRTVSLRPGALDVLHLGLGEQEPLQNTKPTGSTST